jgi:CRP-like cAMP-binding protein
MASEALVLLKPLPLFATFKDEWLDRLYAIADYRETRAGEYLVVEEQESNEVFVILSGRLSVEVTHPDTHGRKTVAVIKEGDLLGELGLVGFDRRSASAHAMTDVASLYWERAALFSLFNTRKEIGFALMQAIARVLAQKLVSTNRDLTSSLYDALYVDETAAK